MTVSVVIATKNRPEDLHATVLGLLAQSRAADELIVVDQSPDSAARCAVERAMATRGRRPGQPPLLHYIHEPSLRGAAAARNVGIDRARGDIVVFLDDDVLLDSHFLRAIVACYARDKVEAVSGIITNYPRPPWWQRVCLRVFWRGPFHDERQPIYWKATHLHGQPPIRVRKLGTTGMSVRRAALGARRFDGRLKHAWPGEDVDLCCQLGRDCTLLIDPEARFFHKRTPVNRPKDHWIKRDVQAMHYLYSRHWNRGLKNRLCFAWLNVGYALLATLGSVRRRRLDPWRLFLEARREAREYRKAIPSSPAQACRPEVFAP